MTRIFVWILLVLAAVITVWMISTDHFAAHNSTRWGAANMTRSLALLVFRWLVLSVAFAILGFSGGLTAWGRWATVLALGSVLVFEVASFFVHFTAADHEVKREFQITFSVIALLSALVIIASG